MVEPRFSRVITLFPLFVNHKTAIKPTIEPLSEHVEASYSGMTVDHLLQSGRSLPLTCVTCVTVLWSTQLLAGVEILKLLADSFETRI